MDGAVGWFLTLSIFVPSNDIPRQKEAGNPFHAGTDPYFRDFIDWNHIWRTIKKLQVLFEIIWVGPIHLITQPDHARCDYLSPAAEGDLNTTCFAQYSMISLLRTMPINLSESSTIGTKFCTFAKSMRSTMSAWI